MLEVHDGGVSLIRHVVALFDLRTRQMWILICQIWFVCRELWIVGRQDAGLGA